MTRLQQIAQQSLKIKAAQLLNKKPGQLDKVEESYNGATVFCKNGNTLQIPNEVWLG